jgi:hypothetical protein
MAGIGPVSPIARLNDHTLVRIFEEYVDPRGGDLQQLFHLLMVCRVWSVSSMSDYVIELQI